MVPNRAERIHNLRFHFIYYLNLDDVLFRKITGIPRSATFLKGAVLAGNTQNITAKLKPPKLEK